MNPILAIKQYVASMVDGAGPGMKVLMMDKSTTSVVSMVYAQSEILQKEVFLFERLDSPRRDTVKSLKCVCFVRPTVENITLLCEELRSAKYGRYYLYFSNIVKTQDVKRLAEADESESVKDIQEMYGDYIPVSPHLFSMGLAGCSQGPQWSSSDALERCVSGLAAFLLSVKRSPVIRYQASSSMTKRLADSIKNLISRESSLFDFRQTDFPPVLLIVDRRSDPYTPLLNQWTYQAMLHELLGIHNNRINLSHVPGLSKDLQEVVMSAEHDDFYAENMFCNFGDTANNIKKLMDDFQAQSKGHAKVESIADMKEFIESYPQFKKMSGTVSKHVTLVSELSRMVSRHNLLKVSEVEQELVAGGDHSSSLQEIRALMGDERVRDVDKLRLVLLYSLCYERHSNNDTHGLVERLVQGGANEKYRKLVGHLLDYGGKSQLRGGDLDLGGQSDLSKATSSVVKKLFRGLKGVENIYTQHTPALSNTLQLLLKGRLKESSHPALHGSPSGATSGRPQEVIVFMVGGATYEEALMIHQCNSSTPGVRIVLGGTTVHNFSSFQREVTTAAEGPPPNQGRPTDRSHF